MIDVLQRLAIVAHGHVNLVLARLSNGVELLEQELDQLGLLFFGDCRKAVDDDKMVVTLVKSDFILLAKVGKVQVILIEFLLVEVGLAKLFETSSRGRHAGQSICRGSVV